MNRRLRLLAVTALCAAALGGCGSDPNAIHVGLVTAPEGPSGSAETSDIASGIESYAADTSFNTRVYTASSDSEESYKIQFDAAEADKTAYVVSAGTQMEEAVYQAQNAHKKQKFLFFDGQPRASQDVESTIRENTECVEISKADMGFLAGYTAVTDGYRNLLYFTGEQTPDKKEAFDGFVRGVEYAMEEHGLPEGNVSVSLEVAGSDALTPLRMTDAKKQYEAGVDLILTDTPGIAEAVSQAASLSGSYLATIGFDAVGSLSRVLFSTVPDRADLVEYLLKSFDSSSGNFKGGEVVSCGGKERAVNLKADYSQFRSFTEAACQNILDAMAEGIASGGAADSGEGTESGESAAVPSSISVKEVTPVPADANAGLGSAAAAPAESAADEAAGATEAAETAETAEADTEADTEAATESSEIA